MPLISDPTRLECVDVVLDGILFPVEGSVGADTRDCPWPFALLVVDGVVPKSTVAVLWGRPVEFDLHCEVRTKRRPPEGHKPPGIARGARFCKKILI